MPLSASRLAPGEDVTSNVTIEFDINYLSAVVRLFHRLCTGQSDIQPLPTPRPLPLFPQLPSVNQCSKSIDLPTYLPLSLSLYLCVCLSVCLSVYNTFYLSIYLSIYLSYVLFVRAFFSLFFYFFLTVDFGLLSCPRCMISDHVI